MDELIEFKNICRTIAEIDFENKRRILQATNEWFASFLEDFIVGAGKLIVKIRNKLEITDKEFANFEKKIYRVHQRKKLIDWVLQEFTRIIPGARENLDEIKACINTTMLAIKNKEYDVAVQTYDYLPGKIKELNKKLIEIRDDLLGKEVLVFACDDAAGSVSFIEQRDNNLLDRTDQICEKIKYIIEHIKSGLDPKATSPKCYGGGLYGVKIGNARRIIFYELEKKISFVICVYIDEKTHNDAVNHNVRNLYRKIIDNEITKDNYFSYRRINPKDLKDFK